MFLMLMIVMDSKLRYEVSRTSILSFHHINNGSQLKNSDWISGAILYLYSNSMWRWRQRCQVSLIDPDYILLYMLHVQYKYMYTSYCIKNLWKRLWWRMDLAELFIFISELYQTNKIIRTENSKQSICYFVKFSEIADFRSPGDKKYFMILSSRFCISQNLKVRMCAII